MTVFAFLVVAFLNGCSSIPYEEGSVNVFFCDQIDCEIELVDLAENSEIKCAMYHPSAEIVNAVGGENLVVDEDHFISGAVVERGSGLMHNKFCVINQSLVWTGSWNPSQKMSVPNNVVLIESKSLSKAYLNEFHELSSGVFHGGKKGSAKTFLNGSLIDVYFCPEDDCKDAVLKVLNSAKNSIKIMAFSFTDDNIGDLVLKKSEVISVRAIFDPRKNRYSEYEKLKSLSKIAKVHHKVFIVDEKIIITGSYNPTKNGNERNDENIMIIHSEEIASLFVDEFERLWPK